MNQNQLFQEIVTDEKDALIRHLRDELHVARANAIRYEHECHSLRQQLQALRQEADTRRLTRHH
jgi:hypothetical protein